MVVVTKQVEIQTILQHLKAILGLLTSQGVYTRKNAQVVQRVDEKV